MSDDTPQMALRTVLLTDADGLLQVVVATQDLLDLAQLEQACERPLKALTRHGILRAHRRRELTPVAGSRHCYALPTVIDKRLANEGHRPVEPDGKSLDEISAALRAAGLDVQYHTCTVPAERLCHTLPDVEQDGARIQRSIQQFTTRRIRQRLDEILEFPPLSPTAERILQLRANPNATADELTAIIESDPSLAAQVVSWASSPYYAAPGRVSSVRDAIVRVLGFELVSNLAVGLILGRAVAIPTDQADGISPYWEQAIYCSMAVETLMRMMAPAQRPRQGMLYLSGLLHNFGYLVLAHTFPPHFSMICRYMEANPVISHVAVEHYLIGICREQIGTRLLQAWRMPGELVAALRYQHDAEYQGEHAVYANLLYMALRLLREQGIGDGPYEDIPAHLFQRYGLNADECREAIIALLHSQDAVQLVEQMSS